jgi:hypothetical protein
MESLDTAAILLAERHAAALADEYRAINQVPRRARQRTWI